MANGVRSLLLLTQFFLIPVGSIQISLKVYSMSGRTSHKKHFLHVHTSSISWLLKVSDFQQEKAALCRLDRKWSRILTKLGTIACQGFAHPSFWFLFCPTQECPSVFTKFCCPGSFRDRAKRTAVLSFASKKGTYQHREQAGSTFCDYWMWILW